MTQRLALLLASAMGFLGVALGAFGAHGLKARLAPLADGAQRLEWWNTGAHYQMIHALAIGLVALLFTRTTATSLVVSAWSFCVGILLFSGSLYVMTLTGIRVLGAVTPLGGIGFLVGWAALFVTALHL